MTGGEASPRAFAHQLLLLLPTLSSPKMVLFGLGTVAYFALLMVNAVAILNKERFLAPLGLTTSSFNQQQQQGGGAYGAAGFDAYGMPVQPQYGGGEVSVKQRAVQLVDAVRTLMRIPLIPINIVVIFYELLFG